jgi:hypothetical protein
MTTDLTKGKKMSRVLVSADTHIAVPPTVADELPDHFRSEVPHLEERLDGMY